MMIRKYLPPFVMWLVFEVIAVTLWFALDCELCKKVTLNTIMGSKTS